MLSIGVQPWGYFRKGIFYENLVEHPLATQHLMPTLIRFFVGELVGCGNMFYRIVQLMCGLPLTRRRDDWRSHSILGQVQL
jgi:hypothetical protein